MTRFFFVIDKEDGPQGKNGWVEVIAFNINLAVTKFAERYPQLNGYLPCKSFFAEEDFLKKKGEILGECLEIIA